MQCESYAPVAIFVYNRISHTKQVVESLMNNDIANKTELYIFSDGPKLTGEIESDKICAKQIKEVRDYVKSISGFKKIDIIEREINYGLAKNITDGIGWVLNRYDKIIVLEDDLTVSSAFLKYMNRALMEYRDFDEVYSISGFSYIREDRKTKNLPETYFLPITCSWGWATWKNKWNNYDPEASGWEILNKKPILRYKFNFGNSIDFYGMLSKQMKKNIDSWAVRWYWSVFCKNGLTLYPLVSFVNNRGFDGSGIHTKGKQIGGEHIFLNEKENVKFPHSTRIYGKVVRIAKNSLGGNELKRIYSFILR